MTLAGSSESTIVPDYFYSMYDKQNKRNKWKWKLNTAGFFTTTTLGWTRRPPPTCFSRKIIFTGSTTNLQPPARPQQISFSFAWNQLTRSLILIGRNARKTPEHAPSYLQDRIWNTQNGRRKKDFHISHSGHIAAMWEPLNGNRRAPEAVSTGCQRQ
jgi:hypothetical protein